LSLIVQLCNDALQTHRAQAGNLMVPTHRTMALYEEISHSPPGIGGNTLDRQGSPFPSSHQMRNMQAQFNSNTPSRPITHCPLCQAADTQQYAQTSTREYLSCMDCRLIFIPPPQFLSADEEKSCY